MDQYQGGKGNEVYLKFSRNIDILANFLKKKKRLNFFFDNTYILISYLIDILGIIHVKRKNKLNDYHNPLNLTGTWISPSLNICN